MPIFRTMSATGVPDSDCLKAKAICASLYRFLFILGSFNRCQTLTKKSHPLWIRIQGADHPAIVHGPKARAFASSLPSIGSS